MKAPPPPPHPPPTYRPDRCDDLDYRIIELKNGLRAVLVSDPDTDKAAAALNVRVGSLLDPPELQGLAHFLEHMLFYASEKYPLGARLALATSLLRLAARLAGCSAGRPLGCSRLVLLWQATLSVPPPQPQS